MRNKHKKESKLIKILGCILLILLVIFQLGTILIGYKKQYYLIYDWIFYVVNYFIIGLLFLLFRSENNILEFLNISILIALLAINSTIFYKMGDTNVVISKSKDKKHELILKEYPKMSFETMRLKRRWVIFGKKVDAFEGSSVYKYIENKKYKIDWSSGDNAIVSYKDNDGKKTNMVVYNFRRVECIQYYYVVPSIYGKWVNKEDKNDYFLCDKEKIVYSNNNHTYYYKPEDTTQYGVLSIVAQKENNPTIAVVLNSDCKFDEHNTVKDGGSITIIDESSDNQNSSVYYKESIK